jgi:cobaltochelatase CobN
MFQKLLSSVAIAWAMAATLAADPIKILAVDNGSPVLNEAKTAFDKLYGAGLVDLENIAGAPTAAQMRSAKVIFFFHPDEQMMISLSAEAQAAHKRGALFVVTPQYFLPRQWGFQQDKAKADIAERYWSFGGVENLTSLLAYLYTQGGGSKKLQIPPPTPVAQSGIYHPKASRNFKDLADFLDWYQTTKANPAFKPGGPAVALTIFNTNLKQRDLAHVDALIAELERNGIAAYAAYGWPFYSLDPFLTIEGKSPLRLILGFNLGIAKPEDSKWLESHGVHILNMQICRQSYKEWSEGLRGLLPGNIPSQIATPERASTAEPILIATTETRPDGTTYTAPVAERVQMAVKRSLRWIALQDKPNDKKRIAMLYYNNPPGKGNLGASYLQVLPTMATLVERLRQAGYVTSDRRPDDQELRRVLEKSGRNVETWAPGELDAMIEGGGMTLYPVELYKRHFATLPVQFREMVTKEYGPPESSEMLHVKDKQGRHFFVLPGVQYGNVFLGVQPLRSTFARVLDTTHDTTIPVPHSYVAAYLWLRHVFKADAIMHVGRHGTLEWLPGKQVLQAAWDHSEALLGDIPNPYYYIMDGDGESLQAMRRSAAVMISHLTPLLLPSGIRSDIQPLKASLQQWLDKLSADPELAKEYEKTVAQQAASLKLDKQLNFDFEKTPVAEWRQKLEQFIAEVLDGPIPAGVHSLGKLPAESVQIEGLENFLRFGFSEAETPLVRGEAHAWAEEIFYGREPKIAGNYSAALRDKIQTQWAQGRTWITNLRLSPAREVDAIVSVLSGRYLPGSPLGEPLRTPGGLPTGRKQYGFDATLIPTKEAWVLGRKMADETLARYRKDHGKYPEKMSMMLWYGETDTHHGAMESMAMHLMGTELTWNARNQVDGVKLVPDSEMKHPRVNVVINISGIYRDGFGDKILLLDKAARLAAAAGNNAISRHDAEVKKALIDQGMDAKQADRLSRARVFGNKPGSYSIGVDRLAESSRDAEDKDAAANLYLHYMNFAFGENLWGEGAPKVLEQQLKGNESVLFSRSSNLYGALDNDDTYSYAGGMAAASKFASGGKAPEFYIHNLRKFGSEKMVDLKTFLATEMNQRLWNPKWIEHMKTSGYAGAREMYREVEHLYGFQATTKEQMDGSFWQNTFDVYVADKQGLELEKFFEKENPHARQNQLARMLEVDRQGSYKFNEADRATLVREYVKSVAKNGVACSANTCGNQKLQQFVGEMAPLVSGLGPLEMQQFGRVIGKATRWSPQVFAKSSPELRKAVEEGARKPAETQQAQRPPRPTPPAPRPPSNVVSGYAMKEKIINLAKSTTSTALPVAWGWMMILLAIMSAGVVWETRLQRFRKD